MVLVFQFLETFVGKSIMLKCSVDGLDLFMNGVLVWISFFASLQVMISLWMLQCFNMTLIEITYLKLLQGYPIVIL